MPVLHPFSLLILFQCTDILLFVYSLVEEHLNYFHFLVIMNDVAMIICVQIFVWTYVFSSFEHILRSRIGRSYGISMFTFWRTTNCFPKIDWPLGNRGIKQTPNSYSIGVTITHNTCTLSETRDL